MTTASAIIIATAMVCCTIMLTVLLVGHQFRHLVREVLNQVKLEGRKVSVNVDKKINVRVTEDDTGAATDGNSTRGNVPDSVDHDPSVDNSAP